MFIFLIQQLTFLVFGFACLLLRGKVLYEVYCSCHLGTSNDETLGIERSLKVLKAAYLKVSDASNDSKNDAPFLIWVLFFMPNRSPSSCLSLFLLITQEWESFGIKFAIESILCYLRNSWLASKDVVHLLDLFILCLIHLEILRRDLCKNASRLPDFLPRVSLHTILSYHLQSLSLFLCLH